MVDEPDMYVKDGKVVGRGPFVSYYPSEEVYRFGPDEEVWYSSGKLADGSREWVLEEPKDDKPPLEETVAVLHDAEKESGQCDAELL